MTNDLNDHHDRMVVVEVFCFMIRKSKAWHSRERQALLITLATYLSRGFTRNTNLKPNHFP